MAKRKTFYVPAAIFEGGHSAYAVAVYAYLCFCCDKSGVCFPGIEAIASHTGMSRSSVKRTLAELERSGKILSEKTTQPCKNGKRRQGTNRYRILDTPVRREPDPRFTENPHPGSDRTAPRFTENREIYNNSKEIMGDVPSVGHNAREDTTGLDAILEPLYLDSFFEQVFFSHYVETVIHEFVGRVSSFRQQWPYSPEQHHLPYHLRVRGERVDV